MIDIVMREYHHLAGNAGGNAGTELAELWLGQDGKRQPRLRCSALAPMRAQLTFCFPFLSRLAVQKEKGGDPEVVRESQRKRGASVELVDEVLERYTNWTKRASRLALPSPTERRAGPHASDLPSVNFNAASKAKEINTIQKDISAKKKVRCHCLSTAVAATSLTTSRSNHAKRCRCRPRSQPTSSLLRRLRWTRSSSR
jgi:hypothetical protein